MVLGVTSAATAAGLRPGMVGFLGNLAASQVVAVMGNDVAVRKRALLADAANLLPGGHELRIVAGQG